MSHLHNSITEECAAVDTAAGKQVTKYEHLVIIHMCVVPMAHKTGESWNVLWTVEVVQDLGKRISEVTNEPLETQYHFNRLSRLLRRLALNTKQCDPGTYREWVASCYPDCMFFASFDIESRPTPRDKQDSKILCTGNLTKTSMQSTFAAQQPDRGNNRHPPVSRSSSRRVHQGLVMIPRVCGLGTRLPYTNPRSCSPAAVHR